MDRREFLAGAGALVSTLAVSQAQARVSRGGRAASDLVYSDADILAQLDVVRLKAFACVAAGYACVQHCNEQLIAGDAADFTDCTLAVHQMVAICQSTATLAAYKAKAIADFLDGCIKACDRCRTACAAHQAHFAMGMHLECKACMEACQACEDACRALQAIV